MAKKKVVAKPSHANTMFDMETIATKTEFKQVITAEAKRTKQTNISNIGLNADWENFGEYISSLKKCPLK